MVLCDLIESHLAFGIVLNAILKLQLGRMTLILKSCTSKIRIQIAFKVPNITLITKAIYSALKPDADLSSSNSRAITRISIHKSKLLIEIQADDIPSLRATVNSYLRLSNATYKCIAS